MTEKLPLPKEWYKNWDLDRVASQPSSASNTDTLDTDESEPLQSLTGLDHDASGLPKLSALA